MNPASAVSTRNGRIAFVLGGSLFIASALLGVVLLPLSPVGASLFYALGESFFVVQQIVTFSAVASFAAGVVVFAVGVPREGSVVGRRPVGMIALSAFALWPIAAMLLFMIPTTIWAEGPPWLGYAMSWGVPLIAGLVGVVLIVRARTVPGGWRWLPLAAFVFVAACSAAYPLTMALTPPTDAYAPIYMIPAMFAIYGGMVASLLLGAVAVGLAVVARSHAKRSGAAETENLAAAPAPSSASS